MIRCNAAQPRGGLTPPLPPAAFLLASVDVGPEESLFVVERGERSGENQVLLVELP